VEHNTHMLIGKCAVCAFLNTRHTEHIVPFVLLLCSFITDIHPVPHKPEGDVPIAVELRRVDVAGVNVTRPS
jgi:hypothetical protein